MSLLSPGPWANPADALDDPERPIPDDETDPVYRQAVADLNAWKLLGATPGPGPSGEAPEAPEHALGCSCEQAAEASEAEATGEAGESAEAQEAPEGATAS